MTEKPIEQFKTRGGNAFRSNVSSNVAAGGTLSLELEDPPGSGKRIVITSIKITTDGPFEMRVPRRFDVTHGTEVNIENKNVGSSTSSVGVAYEDSTYSNADNVEMEYIGSGRGANAFGGADTDVTGAILQGNSMLIEVENLDSSARNVSITVEFYETSPRT